ncbi:hypothetical protein [Vreelandella alkaliphila]|uniref:Uncharacterized protein n=1 Tax=Vreelandella alkaliphila TaxID=272774 RepID=A0AAJ2RXH7_9GAMM|nr:hypothetical protein [Halomonas alkaliphila]MDX5979551.1 hypothetical protein [Halomonas alkaliphila]
MWRRAEPLPAYYTALFNAVTTGSQPVVLETYVAALSGGAAPQPADIVHQGILRRYVSNGVIHCICDIPPGAGDFDTLAFYNADSQLMATCPYPSAFTDEGFTAYVYLSFPLK